MKSTLSDDVIRYCNFLNEKINERNELSAKLVEEAERGSSIIKNEQSIARMKKNTEEYKKLSEEVAGYDIEQVPEEYREAHAEFIRSIDAYMKSQEYFYEFIKEDDTEQYNKSNEYGEKGFKYYRKTRNLIF